MGKLHDAAAQVPYVQDLCIREMIARGCKHVLRRGLQRTGPSHLAHSVAHALNCLLGHILTKSQDQKQKTSKKKKQSVKNLAGWQGIDERGPLAEMSSETMWDAITADVKQKYLFDLPQEREKILEQLNRVSVLRAVCKGVGVQITAREYDFKVASPISVDDVLSLFPVYKGSVHVCKEAKQQLDAAKGEKYAYFATKTRIVCP